VKEVSSGAEKTYISTQDNCRIACNDPDGLCKAERTFRDDVEVTGQELAAADEAP